MSYKNVFPLRFWHWNRRDVKKKVSQSMQNCQDVTCSDSRKLLVVASSQIKLLEYSDFQLMMTTVLTLHTCYDDHVTVGSCDGLQDYEAWLCIENLTICRVSLCILILWPTPPQSLLYSPHGFRESDHLQSWVSSSYHGLCWALETGSCNVVGGR